MTTMPKISRRYRKMLNADEELALIARSHAGDEAATRLLIEAHGPLIEKMTSTYSHRGRRHDDMRQEAVVGFIIGINRFDPERGFRLSTFARWWIRAQLLDYLREQPMIKGGTTQNTRRIVFNLATAKQQLGIHADGVLTRDEANRLASHLDVSVEEIVEVNVRQAADAIVSLDTPIGDGTATHQELLADPATVEELEASIDRERRNAAMAAVLGKLDPRTRDIIMSRYMVDEAETLETLGERYRVSRERIRQLEVIGLNKIRKAVPDQLKEAVAA